jgi:hypothetical protein
VGGVSPGLTPGPVVSGPVRDGLAVADGLEGAPEVGLGEDGGF